MSQRNENNQQQGEDNMNDRSRKALEIARHELTTLHGLIAADGAAPSETWSIDTSAAVVAIDDALTYDDRIDVSIFKKKEFTRDEMLAHLGMTPDNRHDPEAKYKSDNWGKWSSYTIDGRLRYDIGAGCHHEHDCCGCVCRIHVEIAETDTCWMAEVTSSINV